MVHGKKKNRISAENKRSMVTAFGNLFNSLDIPGHSIYAYINYCEFVRVLKRVTGVKKLSKVPKNILTMDDVAFITGKIRPIVKNASPSDPYPEDLMGRNIVLFGVY